MKELNFNNWNDFFKTIDFTYFRTSLIQEKYINIINKYGKISGPGSKLLEIAAGSGYTSSLIADLLKKNDSVIFFSDLSPQLREHFMLSQKCGINIKTKTVNSFNIPFENNTFDIIFHQGFLEHFSDEEIIRLLKEQSRVATYIIFDVPNSRRWNKTQEFGNERFLSHKQWKNLAIKAGLDIVEDSARRLTNPWKKLMPKFIYDSEWFQRNFGESSIIVCKRGR